MKRRDFLKLGLQSTLAFGGSSILSACGGGKDVVPARPSQRSVVAAVRGTDLYEMTRRVLADIGSVEAVVRPGEKVFIKPNFMAVGLLPDPFVNGWSTKPEIVIAVAEECLKAGASEVIIGDGAQVPSWSWEEVLTLDGRTNLSAAAQDLRSTYGRMVSLACLEVDTPEWIEVDASVEVEPGIKKISVSSLFYGADRIISVPVLRTHPWTQLTLSMKNVLGVTPLRRYGTSIMRNLLHEAYAHSGGIEQCFIDILKARKPDLAILDASRGVEGLMSTVDMRDRLGDWLLLAGTDLVAVDATAARIVKHEVGEVKQLGMASAQGLGRVREEDIQVVGPPLEELRVDWLRAVHVEEWSAATSVEAAALGPAGAGGSRGFNYLLPVLGSAGTVYCLKNRFCAGQSRCVPSSD